MLLLQESGGGDSGGGSPDWLTDVIAYGISPTVVVLGFVFGRIVPGYIYERRVEEHRKALEDNRLLEETIKERVIPALLKSTDVMARVLDLLDQLDRDQRTASRQDRSPP